MSIFERFIKIQRGTHQIIISTNRAATCQHIAPDDVYLNIGPMFLNITADEAVQLAQALTEAADPTKRTPNLQAVQS